MARANSKIGAARCPHLIAVLLFAVLACLACAGSRVPEGAAIHEVRSGDTLAEIARGYGVDLRRLARANGITDVDHIEVGRRLIIPDGGRIAHRVRPGESLQGIAHRYRVSVSTIAQVNRIAPGAAIEVGRRLVLPREATLPPPPDPGPDVARARALLDDAAEHYRAARFESAVERAREAEDLLASVKGDGALRARVAFVKGSALAGLGEEALAREAFARVRALDPAFEPPQGWLSPRLEALYRDSQAD